MRESLWGLSHLGSATLSTCCISLLCLGAVELGDWLKHTQYVIFTKHGDSVGGKNTLMNLNFAPSTMQDVKKIVNKICMKRNHCGWHSWSLNTENTVANWTTAWHLCWTFDPEEDCLKKKKKKKEKNKTTVYINSHGYQPSHVDTLSDLAQNTWIIKVLACRTKCFCIFQSAW